MPALDSSVKNLTSTIVFVGRFSPAMFHPSWLLHYKLIRPSEAETAKLNISHPSVAQMQIGSFMITAEENRFLIGSTDQSSFVPMKDLALSVAQLLETTPIFQMGINIGCHFSAKSEKSWHNFGHHLAPKTAWSGFMAKPGLNTMTIQDINKYNERGYVRVKVEPSTRIPHGVFIDVNNHFEFGDAKDSIAAATALRDLWLKVENDTYSMFNSLVGELKKLDT